MLPDNPVKGGAVHLWKTGEGGMDKPWDGAFQVESRTPGREGSKRLQGRCLLSKYLLSTFFPSAGLKARDAKNKHTGLKHRGGRANLESAWVLRGQQGLAPPH